MKDTFRDLKSLIVWQRDFSIKPLIPLAEHRGGGWVTVLSNKASHSETDRHVSEAGTGGDMPRWTSPSSAGPERSCQLSHWVLLNLRWATSRRDALFSLWWWHHAARERKDKRFTSDSWRISTSHNRDLSASPDLNAHYNSQALHTHTSTAHIHLNRKKSFTGCVWGQEVLPVTWSKLSQINHWWKWAGLTGDLWTHFMFLNHGWWNLYLYMNEICMFGDYYMDKRLKLSRFLNGPATRISH